MNQELVATTNYLSPELHYVLKESLIRTAPFHFGRPPMKADRFTFLLDTLYGCGLRVSEGLNLIRSDFNLNNRILTIRAPKTGHKKKMRSDGTIIDNISAQKTTILPYHVPVFEKMLERYCLKQDDVVFPVSRMTVWQYCKNASIMAGLPIAEEQDQKSISGVWTHLFRKSCSKRIQILGASRELRMRKLRHSFQDAHDAYDVVDLNAVKDWEWKQFA